MTDGSVTDGSMTDGSMTDGRPTRHAPTVLMVTPYFPPGGGGLERYAVSIAKGLVDDFGWRVVFVTSGSRGSQTTITEEDGFRVYRLPVQLTVSRTPLNLAWPLRIHAIAR